MRFRIQKPLTRRIEFLENVFHKTNLFVDRAASIILPATFLGDLSIGIFARDNPREIAPERRVHGVKITASGICPARCTLLADGVLREAIEVLGSGIEIGIPRENLPLAIDENFLRL